MEGGRAWSVRTPHRTPGEQNQCEVIRDRFYGSHLITAVEAALRRRPLHTRYANTVQQFGTTVVQFVPGAKFVTTPPPPPTINPYKSSRFDLYRLSLKTSKVTEEVKSFGLVSMASCFLFLPNLTAILLLKQKKSFHLLYVMFF